MLGLKLQYFGHLMRRVDSLEKTLMLGGIGGRRMIGIKRFDVAVIKTGDDSSSKLIVKRVIGLPNETLEFKDNKLYINGEYVEEPFLNNTNTADFKEVLGSNEYFCMGDNREVSRDSRFYGPFSSKQIRSTHLMIFYPFARFGMR